MAIRVKSRSGESTDQMLRRFKKLCEKEGLTKDIKRKEYYEKPSERRRRDMRKAIGRRIREAMELAGELPKRPMRAGRGGPGGSGGGFGGSSGGGGGRM
ncbi:MAG: 30S ribosomal protein S21 [Phycisphaerales bacterium]|jgi:small subunit ribosomal protein S21|nr:30S ribosomal protein S21 [Phycisphaerales bacterium]